MYKLIFFDTETTGNTDKDFLCQLAYKLENESFNELYKPLIKIPPEASAVHHITNKMITEKNAFKESLDFEKIKNLFESDDSIAIAHNAPFDLMMFKKEGIEPKKFICTLRLARYLDPEGKIEKYNLQYLRYLLDLDVEAQAHDAMGDVLVLEKLFERLKKKFLENESMDKDEALDKMIEISSHPSLLKFINFGKHNGKEVEEITRIDPGYLEWLLKSKLESDQIDEDWIYTLKHYLNK
ncbi:MAG: exonuclease domain-containing protein [Candidatus Paceibacterota bacterium]|jgi:DNA polymerase III epsilon subunit-like protein